MSTLTPVFPLPRDIFCHILTKLPLKTLIQLRCVSKSFLFLISHPEFLNTHLSSTSSSSSKHHLLFYDSSDYKRVYFSFHKAQDFSQSQNLEAPFKSVYGYLRLVGSVKGLVCLFDTNYFTYVGTLILWNPFIRKFKILPFSHSFNNSVRHMSVGFGFDHKYAEFKVVKILCDFDNDGDGDELRPEALIYEVKIGSWRSLGKVVPCFLPKSWSGNVFVNGVVHWLAYKMPKVNGQPNCIMGFGIVDEVFKVMDLPHDLGSFKKLRLSDLDGDDGVSTLVLFVCYEEDSHTWDVWVMEEYGKVESWSRRYHVALEDDEFIPLKIMNGGSSEILAAAREDHSLVLIDAETVEMRDVGVSGLWVSFCVAEYMPSLALIDSGEHLVE